MLVVLLVTFVIVLVLSIFIVIKLIDVITSSLAPAISTPDSALGSICDALDINDNDEVWELGCGDAKVISYCAKLYPKAKFVGIENGIIMFLKAKHNSKSLNNVEVRFGNFKSIQPDSATRMFLYLLPEALQIVSSSIPRGCMAVSLEYKFARKQVSRVIALDKPKKFAHRLYIYQF